MEIKAFVESHPDRTHLYYYAHNHLYDEGDDYYAHNHRLKLCDEGDDDRRQYKSLEEEEEEEEIIKICYNCSLPVHGSNYCCKICRHFFHMSCAESPTTIRHPFHISHPLSLLQSPPPPGRSCYVCKLNIIIHGGSANSYCCLDCQIFFHDSCLQLPPRLKKHDLLSYQHHPLFLSSGDDNQDFKCRACSRACYGFSYSCRKYDFQSKICIPCMSSLQTTLPEYQDPPTAHIITIHSIDVSIDYSTCVCRVCSKQLDRLPYFKCDHCRFYLHIHCVLTPTFKSPHHRHILKLTYNHNLGEDEEELICDLCEKTRFPNLPVYQCPKQGCSIVAHCCCALMENNLSIAHELGEKEEGDDRGISLVVIKSRTSMKNASCPEIMKLKDLDDLAANHKVIIDEKEWSDKSLMAEFSMFSNHPNFPKLFINRECRDVKHFVDYFKQFHSYPVMAVGEYTVSTEFEPVMQLLFAKYGDFSKNSFLQTSMEKILFFNILCQAMVEMWGIKDEEITEDSLWDWMDSFKLVHSVGFEIHFAWQRFKKTLHSFFGQHYVDQGMDMLDIDMRMLTESVDPELPVSYFSWVDRKTTCIMIRESSVGEGETVQFKHKFVRRSQVLNDSWDLYRMKMQGEKVEYPRHIERRNGFMRVVGKVRFWDYCSLLDKMEAFSVNYRQHRKINGRFEGIHISLKLCTKCGHFVESCDVMESLPCHVGSDGHNFIPITDLSDFDSRLDLDIDQVFSYVINKCCYVCALPICGSAYSFPDQAYHHLIHKCCLDFPLEFHHSRLHPEHTLTLCDFSPDMDDKKCNACGNNVSHHGQVYICKSCNFYLDPKCVFRDHPITVPSQSCGHPLSFVEQNIISHQELSCYFCKTVLPCSPYLYCGQCDLSSCILCVLPSRVSYSNHCHDLQITELFVEDDTKEYYCYACEKPRNGSRPVYYCHECAYTAHIGCIISGI